MKTCNRICLICLILLIYGCNKSDDDSSSSMQATTEELLTSGKWYFESKTPGTYTSCEKSGYIQFRINGTLILESFDESSGTCVSLGEIAATYTLTNNRNLTIEFGSDTESAVINSISEEALTLQTDVETLNFDKTKG